jgi:hypothetical protein
MPTTDIAVVIDTNLYRGWSDARFDLLLSAERARGIRPLVDPWTLAEIAAGLADRSSEHFRFYVGAARRTSRRNLVTSADTVVPSDDQAHRFIFGDETPDHRHMVQRFADAVLNAAEHHPDEWPHDLKDELARIALMVQESEEWYAGLLAKLSETLKARAGELGQSVSSDLRAALRSDLTLQMLALAQAGRVQEKSGRTLDEARLESLVPELINAFRPGYVATAVALERVICENADLSKSRNRNLIWDIEIAFNIGQGAGARDIIVVSNDGLMHETARRCNVPSSVHNHEAYAALLGLPAA